MDAELEFAIQPSTTGKQLFDQVYIQTQNKEVFLILKVNKYMSGYRDLAKQGQILYIHVDKG